MNPELEASIRLPLLFVPEGSLPELSHCFYDVSQYSALQ